MHGTTNMRMCNFFSDRFCFDFSRISISLHKLFKSIYRWLLRNDWSWCRLLVGFRRILLHGFFWCSKVLLGFFGAIIKHLDVLFIFEPCNALDENLANACVAFMNFAVTAQRQRWAHLVDDATHSVAIQPIKRTPIGDKVHVQTAALVVDVEQKSISNNIVLIKRQRLIVVNNKSTTTNANRRFKCLKKKRFKSHTGKRRAHTLRQRVVRYCVACLQLRYGL